jgi:hypothetical protein
MRSGFLTLCGLLSLTPLLLGQDPAPPTVVEQPVGLTAYVGDAAALRPVIAGTAPIRYQWNRDNVALAGATNATLAIATAALTDTALYDLVATNDYGSVRTGTVLVYVTKRPQTLTFNAPTSALVSGTSVTLTATSSLNLPVTFTLVSGAAVLNGTALTGSGGPVVIRASQAGNDSIAAADSLDRTFVFASGNLAPFITSPPVDLTATGGTTVTLRTAAIGTPAPAYQWAKDGAPVAGATNPSLVLPTVTLADTGRYAVTATNALGSASASAVLTVRTPPTVTEAPANQTVFAGDNVRLAVTVSAFPAPTYQWRRNGTAVSGATNASLALNAIRATDAGRYDVVVTNALGTVTTTPATLTVVTRDFSGAYFGQLTGSSGSFAIYARADRTAVFLGYFPELASGIATTDLRLDATGAFSLSLTTLAGSVEANPLGATGEIAAAPQAVTLLGRFDESTGTVTGQISGLNMSFKGTRAPATGPAAANAGFYRLGLIGSAAGGYGIVAADGRAFVLTAAGATPDAATGTLSATGRLVVSTTALATIDLAFTNGTVTGTVKVGSNAAGLLSGATDERAADRRLVNLSVRALNAQGNNALITGFVIAGDTSKQVLVRAAGPALSLAPFNLANALPDPAIQLYRGSNVTAQNDDWGTPATNVAAITAAAARAGAFAFRNGSADSALLGTLSPGAYTVAVSGGQGTVLAEVYEVLATNEAAGSRRLVNLSARGAVASGSPLIAGFVISGSAPQLVLIRGIGPALAAAPFNLGGALANPQLTLVSGNTTIKTNDDWFRDAEATLVRLATAKAGAFPLGASSLDAAMLVYLAPGAYTAQVSGPANANQANASGIALVEIYEVSP